MAADESRSGSEGKTGSEGGDGRSPSAGGRVLVVDDSALARKFVKKALSGRGFDVEVADGADEALARVGRWEPEVVVTDLHMPGVDGLALLERIRDVEPTVPVIILSGDATLETALAAIRAGAFDFVQKEAADTWPLQAAVARAVSHCRLARENVRLTIELEHKLSVIEEQKELLLEEQRKSERLLRNILPVSVAEKLKRGERSLAAAHPEVTVLFADVVGFSALATRLSADVLVATLNELFSLFDQLADKFGVEKIKTIGDAYMAACGLPKPRADHVQLMARFALEMLDAVETRNSIDGGALALRIGIHTGPVVAGVIGEKRLIYDLWGDTVNIASRMEAHGVEGRIHVTESVEAALRSEFDFESRGLVDVKGRGPMKTYFLVAKLEQTLRTRSRTLAAAAAATQTTATKLTDPSSAS